MAEYDRTRPEPQERRTGPETAKDILLYYGINPYFGKENLAYAPLYLHTVDTIKYMSQEIVKLFKSSATTTAKVTAKLKEFADKWVDHTLNGMKPGG